MTTPKILENKCLSIKDGIIVQISDEIPEGQSKIIDGKGKYVVPGLFDMHIHIEGDDFGDLCQYLAYGITSVRNMWGTEDILKFRTKLQSHSIYPTLYTAGPLMDGDPPVWKESYVITTEKEAEKAVISIKAQGYDFLKVYNNLSLEVYKKIIATAKEINIDVTGHLPVAVDIQTAIELGQYSLEHAKAIPREYLASAAKNGIWFIPTLVVNKAVNMIKNEEFDSGIFEDPKYEFVSPERLEQWKELIAFYKEHDFRFDRFFEEYSADTRLYSKAGGKLLAGTDAPNPFIVPGISLHEELEIFAKVGHSPWEILKSATVNAAECMHVSDRVGTIEQGKVADIIILERNPLENIANTRTIDSVIKNGHYLRKEQLNKLVRGEIDPQNIIQ